MIIDLHSHTLASDGRSTADEIVANAKRYGLHGLALTDHHVTYHPESDKVAKALEKAGIVAFRGAEYSSSGGHMLVFGCDVAKLNLGRYAAPQDVINKVNDAGGCVVPSHPFKGYKYHFDAKVADLKDIPAWEGLNGQCGYQCPSANTDAWDLAVKLERNMTGGSDAHVATGLGLAWTEFDLSGIEDDAQLVGALWEASYVPYIDPQRAKKMMTRLHDDLMPMTKPRDTKSTSTSKRKKER